MTSVSKQFVTRILNPHAFGGLTEFMDFDHVIRKTDTDCLQNAKSLTIFEDFVVQEQSGPRTRIEVRGQGQGLVNWSSRTRTFIEDNNTS